ncbi:CLUMA_CG001026, isoform A [Clunio marinus]|uniref:CLUMA_CG001026, isoform A n=1 Tax=Clunio marinus TaxID=568069 RepID=A0A1J1HL91_9DIPT|nr:CLUMA_CG001026, isoform A [Clunio marinus]
MRRSQRQIKFQSNKTEHHACVFNCSEYYTTNKQKNHSNEPTSHEVKSLLKCKLKRKSLE